MVVVQLNYDILSEILSRLRVKHLIRFKSVCKEWHRLISSQVFVNLHLKKSSLKAIVLKKEDYLAACPCLLPPPHEQEAIDHRHPSESEIVLAGSSCDGLVCLFYHKFGILHIWNPAIRSSACIPIQKPDDIIKLFWFGLHDNEYKFLLATSSQIHLIRPYVDHYNYKSTQEFGRHYGTPRNGGLGTLFNGNVHWAILVNRGWAPRGHFTILSYGLLHETVGEISLPAAVRERTVSVDFGEIDGCLSCLVSCYSDIGGWWADKFEVWAMKEYGVEESWVKLMDISVDVYLRDLYRVIKEEVEEDLERIKSPLYRRQLYVESLVSPRQWACCRT